MDYINKHNDKDQGFTLMELTIVIIIIGFLIAGVSAGQSLIKASKLNAVINEATNYKTATLAFKTKYGYFPGDFNNANVFWSSQTNGDGNGIIQHNWGVINTETIYFWGHLKNAGLINGPYNGVGVAVGGDNYESIGNNVPASKFRSDTGWGVVTINWDITWNIGSIWYGMDYKSYLLFGSRGQNMMFGGTLLPSDAFNIDSKIDDGLPNTGAVLGAGSNLTTTACINGGTASSTYTFATSTRSCMLAFRL